MRADNRLFQVEKEVLLLAPYSTSISHLSKLIKGSRSSVYRVFKYNQNLKLRVKELLGTKENSTPPLLTDTKKIIVLKTETKKGKDVSIKLPETDTNKKDEKIVELEVIRTDSELYKTHHTPQQRIDKSLEICRLIAKGYAVYEACEINELGNTTFFGWAKKYPEIKSMYATAKELFVSARDENFMMQSYIALEKQLEQRTITNINKIGRTAKNGKVTTHTVIQKTSTKDPSLKAIFKVLTTLCSDTFGTEREREKAKEKNSNEVDYSLKLKTDEEIEELLSELEPENKQGL